MPTVATAAHAKGRDHNRHLSSLQQGTQPVGSQNPRNTHCLQQTKAWTMTGNIFSRQRLWKALYAAFLYWTDTNKGALRQDAAAAALYQADNGKTGLFKDNMDILHKETSIHWDIDIEQHSCLLLGWRQQGCPWPNEISLCHARIVIVPMQIFPCLFRQRPPPSPTKKFSVAANPLRRSSPQQVIYCGMSSSAINMIVLHSATVLYKCPEMLPALSPTSP